METPKSKVIQLKDYKRCTCCGYVKEGCVVDNIKDDVGVIWECVTCPPCQLDAEEFANEIQSAQRYRNAKKIRKEFKLI